MTLTLTGADIRGYFAELGIQLPGWARTEASVRCFAHPDAHRRGDHDPSCSVNLEHGSWHCHACGAKGGAFDAATAKGHSDRSAIDLMVRHGLIERRSQRTIGRLPTRGGSGARPNAREPKRRSRPALQISERDVERWETGFAAQTQLIARLTSTRGWRYRTIRELRLGFDRGRITIPVRDNDLSLIGLLRYQPWPSPNQPKMLAAPGSRRALLPHPAAETSRRVLLVEGEPDMIAARSRGLPAIAVPGADAWRSEWAQLFAGRSVTIVMDGDPEGRKVAERIERDLGDHAEAAIIDLAPERADGYDLTQWLLERASLAVDVVQAELVALQLRPTAHQLTRRHL